jgi:hypothetical protein
MLVLSSPSPGNGLAGYVDKGDSQSGVAVIQGWKLGAGHDLKSDRRRRVSISCAVLAARARARLPPIERQSRVLEGILWIA